MMAITFTIWQSLSQSFSQPSSQSHPQSTSQSSPHMLPFTLGEAAFSTYQTTKPKLDQLLNLDNKLGTLLDLCVSSLRRGHANLLCIVPILSDDPRRESNRGLQNRVMGLEGAQKNTFSNELEHELFIVKGSQSCRVLKYVNIKTSCPDDLIVLKPL